MSERHTPHTDADLEYWRRRAQAPRDGNGAHSESAAERDEEKAAEKRAARRAMRMG